MIVNGYVWLSMITFGYVTYNYTIERIITILVRVNFILKLTDLKF